MACVKYPFALLYGNWTWNDTVGSVSCDYCNVQISLGGKNLKDEPITPVSR